MADIINGQVVGTWARGYNCGIGGLGTCYQYNTYRVRKFKNRLLITRTYSSRSGDSAGELVCSEAYIQEIVAAGVFNVDFRQSALFAKLAKQPVLSAEGFIGSDTQLSSTYTQDNESVLKLSDFDGTTPAITNPNTPNNPTNNGNNGGNNNGGNTTNGLTLDQLLPYIAGTIVLLGVVLIVVLNRK
ncbi:hypothetical protein [Fibrella aquatilis]|uniref:Uncharacterized protein n=1 Tax=Fibrella aquatilis TaxID=2817059 RepID=A0A939G0W6_9BACT|nr:hypothetical protein [Fibrella aquatilis]MBO0930372.1 hypothetical protein [Fibrella aquatilis]